MAYALTEKSHWRGKRQRCSELFAPSDAHTPTHTQEWPPALYQHRESDLIWSGKRQTLRVHVHTHGVLEIHCNSTFKIFIGRVKMRTYHFPIVGTFSLAPPSTVNQCALKVHVLSQITHNDVDRNRMWGMCVCVWWTTSKKMEVVNAPWADLKLRFE